MRGKKNSGWLNRKEEGSKGGELGVWKEGAQHEKRFCLGEASNIGCGGKGRTPKKGGKLKPKLIKSNIIGGLQIQACEFGGKSEH